MTVATPTVWLTLQAHNAPRLIDYYVNTFGFVLAAQYGDGEKVDHAQLQWPEGCGGIMLGSYRPNAPWCREPGTAGGDDQLVEVAVDRDEAGRAARGGTGQLGQHVTARTQLPDHLERERQQRGQRALMRGTQRDQGVHPRFLLTGPAGRLEPRPQARRQARFLKQRP